MTTSLLLSLTIVLAAPGPKKTDEPAPGKLEGDWVVESFEGGPKEATPPGSVTFRFADGRISIKDSTGKVKEEDGGYTIDLTKKPAAIDIKPDKGPKKLIQGIFEIKGDTLKICFAKDGNKDGTERPKEFKSDAATHVIVINLKRVKPEK